MEMHTLQPFTSAAADFLRQRGQPSEISPRSQREVQAGADEARVSRGGKAMHKPQPHLEKPEVKTENVSGTLQVKQPHGRRNRYEKNSDNGPSTPIERAAIRN